MTSLPLNGAVPILPVCWPFGGLSVSLFRRSHGSKAKQETKPVLVQSSTSMHSCGFGLLRRRCVPEGDVFFHRQLGLSRLQAFFFHFESAAVGPLPQGADKFKLRAGEGGDPHGGGPGLEQGGGARPGGGPGGVDVVDEQDVPVAEPVRGGRKKSAAHI